MGARKGWPGSDWLQGLSLSLSAHFMVTLVYRLALWLWGVHHTGSDELPGGPGWSWLSSCRALAVGTSTCQALLLPWGQELNWQI